jgi:hypothetical protein
MLPTGTEIAQGSDPPLSETGDEVGLEAWHPKA